MFGVHGYSCAVWYFVFRGYYKNKAREDQLFAFAFLCLLPSLILIDHGHFQY
jgi:hypothetical protein